MQSTNHNVPASGASLGAVICSPRSIPASGVHLSTIGCAGSGVEASPQAEKDHFTKRGWLCPRNIPGHWETPSATTRHYVRCKVQATTIASPSESIHRLHGIVATTQTPLKQRFLPSASIVEPLIRCKMNGRQLRQGTWLRSSRSLSGRPTSRFEPSHHPPPHHGDASTRVDVLIESTTFLRLRRCFRSDAFLAPIPNVCPACGDVLPFSINSRIRGASATRVRGSKRAPC